MYHRSTAQIHHLPTNHCSNSIGDWLSSTTSSSYWWPFGAQWSPRCCDGYRWEWWTDQRRANGCAAAADSADATGLPTIWRCLRGWAHFQWSSLRILRSVGKSRGTHELGFRAVATWTGRTGSSSRLPHSSLSQPSRESANPPAPGVNAAGLLAASAPTGLLGSCEVLWT